VRAVLRTRRPATYLKAAYAYMRAGKATKASALGLAVEATRRGYAESPVAFLRELKGEHVRQNPPAPFTIPITRDLEWEIQPTWTGVDLSRSTLRMGSVRYPLDDFGATAIDSLTAGFLGWTDDSKEILDVFSEAYPAQTTGTLYRVADKPTLPAGKRAWFNPSLDGVLVAAHHAHGIRYPHVKVWSYPASKLRLLAPEPPELWQRAVADLVSRLDDHLLPAAVSNLEFVLTSRGGGPRFQEGYLASSVHGIPKRRMLGSRVPDDEVARTAPFSAILF